jgi:hypothetical protein
MRSLSHSFLRSRALWHFLAVAGMFTLPTPSLGSVRPVSATTHPFADQFTDKVDQIEQFSEFSIAQAEPGSEENLDANDEATEESPDAATNDTIDLQLGDTDPRVTEIQRLLTLGGYYEGEPSGIFDISTDLSVSRFQESQGLESTGIVDSATWERLQRLESSPSSPESQTKSPELEEQKDTSSRPNAGTGGFSKLMLWLSLLIVVIGVVGMVFYWLLRVFEGRDHATDIDDFDELSPEDSLDPWGGELAKQAMESGASLSLAIPPEMEPEMEPETELGTEPVIANVSNPILSPISDPIAATTHVQPVITPPLEVSEVEVSEVLEIKPEPEPAPTLPTQPPTPVQESPPQPRPIETPIKTPIETPIANTPIAQTPPPATPQPPTPEIAISMASLPAPAAATTSLSPVISPVEAALTADIVSSKVSITERLLQDLHHPEPSQRKKAIWELGRRGDSRAIQPLVNLMLQSDSQQRSLILAVLAEINTRSLEPMQQALALSFQDDSPEVRKNALRDLTRIFDSMSQMGYFISSSLHDRDPSVRETAQWAMTQLARIRSSAEVNQIRPDDHLPPP